MNTYKLFLITIVFCMASSIVAAKVHSHDYFLNTQNDLKIYLKEKTLTNNKNAKVIILVNSLSIPSVAAFDVPQFSLMDKLAENGFDVWGIDFVAQGKASFPPSMQKNPPPTGIFPLRATEALPQLAHAIDFITQKTGKTKVTLLGWSWGSIVAAMYAIKYPTQVDHLILYGAMYADSLPQSAQAIFLQPYATKNGQFNEHLPAYQNIPWKIIQSHWQMMTNGNATIASQAAFNAVGNTYRSIDKHPIEKGTLRRPMGPMKDLFLTWHHQVPYPIKQITTPTLVIYGEQDIFADKTLFSQLTHVKHKKEVHVKEATHWLIYEKNRSEFYNAVTNFINNEH